MSENENEKQKSTLLPCSKCGGRPDLFHSTIGLQYIMICKSCAHPGPLCNYANEAVAKWNEMKNER